MSKPTPAAPKRDVVSRVFFRTGAYVFTQVVDNVTSKDYQLTLEGHYVRIVKDDKACLVPLTNVLSIHLEG